MTMALRCAAGQIFAATAPVAGVNIGPACPAAPPVPLIAFHGTDDPLVPYEGANGVPIVESEVDTIAANNGCTGPPTVTTPFEDARHTVFQGCPDGMDVELWTVIGGGHTWPGLTTYVDPTTLFSKKADGTPTPSPYGLDQLVKHQSTDVVATTLMLDFFDAHHRG